MKQIAALIAALLASCPAFADLPKICEGVPVAAQSFGASSDPLAQIPEGVKLIRVVPIFQTIVKPLCMVNQVTGQKECIPQYWGEKQIGVQAIYLFMK